MSRQGFQPNGFANLNEVISHAYLEAIIYGSANVYGKEGAD
jgi:hypothetical protein